MHLKQSACDRAKQALNSRLIRAVCEDRPEDVRRLIAEGADPSAIRVRTIRFFRLGAVNGACDSLLILAARNGTANSHDIMRCLIASGANVGYVNNWGETAAGIVRCQRDRLREYGIDGVLIEVLLSLLRPVTKSSGA